jgi:1-acyl-sn-glycerol-3-phosphate acyltransferase
VWLYRLNRSAGPALGLYWRLGLEGAVAAVPAHGPLIVASNHASYLDPWLLGMVFPRRIRYLITRQWYDRSAAWQAVFRGYGTVPVRADDPEGTVAAVCGVLARGEVAGIFPEGRISRSGRLGRFRPGLAWIAARSGAPVIPVGIQGSFASLAYHRRVPWPARVTVRVGEPIAYPGGSGELLSAEGEAFRDHVFAEISRLAGQPASRRPAAVTARDAAAASLSLPRTS